MPLSPSICTTITAPTMAVLCARRDAAAAADLVELRLDSVRDPDVAGALKGRRQPVVITCRASWEGGQFRGSEEERRRLLAQALDAGAEYVDLEWRADFTADLVAKTGGRRVVISHHDFSGVPADLVDRLAAMRRTGAEVVKLAAQVRALADCVPLLEAGLRFGADGPLVLLGMGRQGFVTRALAARFGSCWTYAGSEASLGQIPIEQMLGEYRFRRVTASTAIYGLAGAPLAHSVSPAMHNGAFGAAGLDAVYVPFEASDVDDFFALASALDVRGVSVTIPFKRDCLARADEVDDIARTAGAVNTLKREGDRWLGTNTDVAGFLAPLEGRSLAGARVAILGAGGAARAVATALAGTGARVSVRARKLDDAIDVARLADGASGPMPPAPGTWDILVNTTPVGMFPHVDASPIPAGALGGGLVYDLVYNPPVTRLLEEAAAAGCETIGGLDMLVAQARAQFRWWTGLEADGAVMKEAATGRLAQYAAADRA
jgi:3-dehydroquinate dehydratase/shikimate dehydrogenase